MTDAKRPTTPAGPLGFLLELFSSVRFGITLLAILLVYSWLGSAGIFYPTNGPALAMTLGILATGTLALVLRNLIFGIASLVGIVAMLSIGAAADEVFSFDHLMLRRLPIFELTEFEWFHTWFFFANITLMCANITVTTLRRIPFTPLRYGVWMIHSGIIMMSVGCVIYFGLKVEGDTFVIRRQIVASVGEHAVTLPALTGSSATLVTGDGAYLLRVDGVDPSWPLMSAGFENETAYAVRIAVEPPEGRPFQRQLLDGYPQFTEDIIPGQGRAKNIESIGTALVDDGLSMSLAQPVQHAFWQTGKFALSLRETAVGEWTQRPIGRMPRYNDYAPPDAGVLSSPTSVDPVRVLPAIDIDVPALDGDGLGVSTRLTGYLRFAHLIDRLGSGGACAPTIDVSLFEPSTGETIREYLSTDQRVAPALLAEGWLAFREVTSEEQLESLRTPRPSRLTIAVPEAAFETTIDLVPDNLVTGEGDWTPVEGTGFFYRVEDFAPELPLPSGGAVSVAMIGVQRVDADGHVADRYTRWVFPNGAQNRDFTGAGGEEDPAANVRTPDPRVVTSLDLARRSAVTIVTGPEADDGLRVLLDRRDESATLTDLPVGRSLRVAEDVLLSVNAFERCGALVKRPVIVPRSQRDPDQDRALVFAMAHVELTKDGETVSVWAPYHPYDVPNEDYRAVSLGLYRPAIARFSDGSAVEVLFTRPRLELPEPLTLDEFVLTTHVGGFTGETSSIRDWTSIVTDPEGEAHSISTNKPARVGNLWFFQKTWDPDGQRYTGLGVANRFGVNTMLVGSTLSVIGMLYAFYVKPVLRRRMKQQAIEAARLRGVGVEPEGGNA
ncbi:MAG: hypothetical protein AAGD00_08790 [Planctomycetota bacterium]